MNVIFDEIRMRMKCEDLELIESENMVENAQFEVEVPTIETKDDEKVKL